MQLVKGIYLPEGDKHFVEQISNNPEVGGVGTYQLPKLRAALEIDPLRRGLAIDVGAHVGLWTRLLAMEFDRVIAVEPTQEFVRCLLKNISPNGERVTIWQFPLADTPRQLAIKRGHETATAQICPDGEEGDFILKAGTLDQYDLRELDFLKLDCEGFEYFVIKGGEETIRRERPVIVVEQKKKRLARYGLSTQQPAVKLLQSWGAKEYWAKSGDHCLGWK